MLNKVKLGISFFLVLVTTITTGYTMRVDKNNSEPTVETQYVYITAAPEIKYITVTETEVVTEVVTEIVTEIQYEMVYPDDYEEIHDAFYNAQIEYEAHLANTAERYPTATYVWRALTETYGLNPYVAAGIIGNMMNECGGNTLTLRWNEYGGSKGYYGLCMWSLKYHPTLAGVSIDTQLNYLMSSIENTFKTWGKLYKAGFTYEDFCNLTDVRAASDAFMVVYERCGSSSKKTRENNAAYAYSVFVQ